MGGGWGGVESKFSDQLRPKLCIISFKSKCSTVTVQNNNIVPQAPYHLTMQVRNTREEAMKVTRLGVLRKFLMYQNLLLSEIELRRFNQLLYMMKLI